MAKTAKKIEIKGRPRPTQAERPDCSIEGCTGGQVSRGFCSRHYEQWRRKRLDDDGRPIKAAK